MLAQAVKHSGALWPTSYQTPSNPTVNGGFLPQSTTGLGAVQLTEAQYSTLAARMLPLLGAAAVAARSRAKAVRREQLNKRTVCFAEGLEGHEVSLLKQGAESGDPESCFMLGKMLLDGENEKVERDPVKAASLFMKAAGQGLPGAQFNLGMLLLSGEGIEKNAEQGIFFLEKAAEQGEFLAQHILGVTYMEGEEVEQDMDKAVTYFGEAAEAGVTDAQYVLGYMLLDTPPQATEEKVWAAHWLTKAAEGGDPRAQYQISRMFLLGVGMEKNDEAAANWASTAAGSGYTDAQYLMGTLLLSGTGVAENKEWAAYWFEQASQQGHIDAQYNLGLMLDTGDGVPQDKEKGKYWQEQAAASEAKAAQGLKEDVPAE